ncbi:MAG: nucleoside-diphosphate sugar epimerase [Pseudomonadota bacterium]|nr:nucleoside-diphosphate sugar epimerase [Pseudomonadota bacterium]
MSAVVLGGTGAIGASLVTQLSHDKRFQRILVVSRRELDLATTFPEANLSNLQCLVVDFAQLSTTLFKHLDAGMLAFNALGTTQKQAGSKAGFKAIDHGYSLAFAKVCEQVGTSKLIMVTAAGAKIGSISFYNHIKGLVERDVAEHHIETIHFLRPSLLLGRPADGRATEQLAQCLLAPIARWLPLSIRPVHVDVAASAMIVCAFELDGINVISNQYIHTLARQ